MADFPLPLPLPERSEACERVAGVLAAVALDCATPGERAEVQRHVANCARCALELEQLVEGAAYLGLGVPAAELPSGLKQRVLAAALAERPAGHAVRPNPVALLNQRWRRVPATAVAVAAAVAISVGSLGWAVSLQRQVTALSTQAASASTQAAHYQTVVSVLESANLRVQPLAPMPQTVPTATGTVYMDPASGTGMLMLRGMPPLPKDHAWQVWFVRGTERVSGGMVWCDANGAGYSILKVPPDVQNYDSIGLTNEPGPNGSPWPTTQRVLGSSL